MAAFLAVRPDTEVGGAEARTGRPVRGVSGSGGGDRRQAARRPEGTGGAGGRAGGAAVLTKNGAVPPHMLMDIFNCIADFRL